MELLRLELVGARTRCCAKKLALVIIGLICAMADVRAQGTLPVVAVHDSELTRALETMSASTNGATPTGPGTTGFQWWPVAFHYFFMPDVVKETLRSDGTSFTVVSDANISAGQLLNTNGQPKYPIFISLCSEAVADNEIARLTNYVAAGGTLLMGGSAFTRTTNGAGRGDFAIANAMGLHMLNPGMANWVADVTFTKLIDHPLVAHIPGATLQWNMPVTADEVSWGVSPIYALSQGHLIWQVQASNATVIAQGDNNPYLTTMSYGHGTIIYIAAMEPFLGHGGNAPGMYAYGILRNAIQGAFAAANLPIPKLSPWPYAYDAALGVRHDLENLQDQISSIEASAQFEHTNGAKGDYYFCTGTLRVEMTNSAAVIGTLRSAVTNYGATIGPHDGNLTNINNFNLVLSNYDYWHWATDEGMAAPASHVPAPYTSSTNYAFASASNSFRDVEGWLSGITNGLRLTVAPHFNATREPSYQIEKSLNVKATGEQKLSIFPSWVLSTSLQTADMRYSFVSLPTSEWYLAPPLVAQAMEDNFADGTMRQLVDFYYNWGGLVNLYSHSSSAGGGFAGELASDYVTYSMSKPRIWPANAASIYTWWLARSNAQFSATYATNGSQSIVTFSISGARDARAAVELLVPRPSVSSLTVKTNGVAAGTNIFRTNGPVIKVQVGTTVTNAQLKYFLNPGIQNNFYTMAEGTTLSVAAPGVLTNALPGAGTNLVAVPVSGPANGALGLTNNGGFDYAPLSNFTGIDSFTYLAHDNVSTSAVSCATIDLTPPAGLFYDNFIRSTNADPLAPWVPVLGTWTIGGGLLQASDTDVGTEHNAYVPGTWTNYSVQAQIQFQPTSFSGGLNGRLNPLNGAKYSVDLYPNGFPGFSTGSVLEILKFHSWGTLGPSAMAQVVVPTLGTNWHTLQALFQGNQISAYLDGVLITNVTDNGFDGLPAYATGGIGAHFYTFMTPSQVTYSNLLVSTVTLANNDNYTTAENQALSVAAPGVLANDFSGAGANLIALLSTGPTNGSLTLNSNGGFIYTPAANYFGTDSFSYQAFDGLSTSGVAVVTITINQVHYGPVLPSQANLTVNELATLVVTNTASDVMVPPEVLAYVLVNPPAGAGVSTNGIFTWTPSQAQAPSTNPITTIVSDNGSPSLSATNVFTVVVNDLNSAPVLPAQTNRTILGLAPLMVTNTASDSDIHVLSMTYRLLTSPTNAMIDTNGIISWTPVLAQLPSTNVIKTAVTDFDPYAVNGQNLSATNSFTVVVKAIHNGPVLPSQNNQTINELATLVVTNTASDADVPALTLSYLLTNAPAGATISTNGIISWTPTQAQAPSTNSIMTIVTDSGTPALSATNSFTVTVRMLPGPMIISIQLANGSATITWSAVSGQSYMLQYKSDLGDSAWTDLPPDVEASGPSASTTDAYGSASQRFYRVMLLP